MSTFVFIVKSQQFSINLSKIIICFSKFKFEIYQPLFLYHATTDFSHNITDNNYFESYNNLKLSLIKLFEKLKKKKKVII